LVICSITRCAGQSTPTLVGKIARAPIADDPDHRIGVGSVLAGQRDRGGRVVRERLDQIGIEHVHRIVERCQHPIGIELLILIFAAVERAVLPRQPIVAEIADQLIILFRGDLRRRRRRGQHLIGEVQQRMLGEEGGDLGRRIVDPVKHEAELDIALRRHHRHLRRIVDILDQHQHLILALDQEGEDLADVRHRLGSGGRHARLEMGQLPGFAQLSHAPLPLER
jgi:hypothetical protein